MSDPMPVFKESAPQVWQLYAQPANTTTPEAWKVEREKATLEACLSRVRRLAAKDPSIRFQIERR